MGGGYLDEIDTAGPTLRRIEYLLGIKYKIGFIIVPSPDPYRLQLIVNAELAATLVNMPGAEPNVWSVQE